MKVSRIKSYKPIYLSTRNFKIKQWHSWIIHTILDQKLSIRERKTNKGMSKVIVVKQNQIALKTKNTKLNMEVHIHKYIASMDQWKPREGGKEEVNPTNHHAIQGVEIKREELEDITGYKGIQNS